MREVAARVQVLDPGENPEQFPFRNMKDPRRLSFATSCGGIRSSRLSFAHWSNAWKAERIRLAAPSGVEPEVKSERSSA